MRNSERQLHSYLKDPQGYRKQQDVIAARKIAENNIWHNLNNLYPEGYEPTSGDVLADAIKQRMQKSFDRVTEQLQQECIGGI